jgi:amidase
MSTSLTQANELAPAAIDELAATFGLYLSADERQTVAEVGKRLLADAAAAVALAPPVPSLPGTRDPGERPRPEEDPYNALVRWCDVALPRASGSLSGLRVALKDCIAVGGIPLTGGSELLEGFVPNADSALARRILESGGRIVAIANMDCLAWSGYGDTSAYGPTLNPFDARRTAGGSSGGSAAAVHYDNVDGAFGCDQGGSVRLPAAFCGVIGLKPTFGLVPYTRILGIDQAVDHAGPIASSANVVARLLDATAGRDPGDPRQTFPIPSIDAVQAVADASGSLEGLRVSVLREGLDSEVIGVTDEVRAAFLAALDDLSDLGATIVEASIPEHLHGGYLDVTACMEGMLALLTAGGNGYQWRGEYWPELAAAVVRGFAERANTLSLHVKVILMCAEYLRRQQGGATYATTRNLHRRVRSAYTAALAEVDVLALPTTPWLAHRLDEPDMSLADRVMRGWGVTANTAPTNISGHPAISLPMAEVNGLAVGVMLVGPFFSEERLLSIARTIEQTNGWRPDRPKR